MLNNNFDNLFFNPDYDFEELYEEDKLFYQLFYIRTAKEDELTDAGFDGFYKEMQSFYKSFLHIPNKYLIKIIDRIPPKWIDRIASKLVEGKEKYSEYTQVMNVPDNIKFGLELEFRGIQAGKMNILYEAGILEAVMKALDIPDDVVRDLCSNIGFNKKNINSMWTFSREGISDTEISTPILTNSPQDINKLNAVCTLLRALNCVAPTPTTSLQVNVGVDYLECNKKALDNYLLIGKECEELFYKMASPERNDIRYEAYNKATPIKGNIQKYFKEDGSLNLTTQEEINEFLFYIQARNRTASILSYYRYNGNFFPEDEYFNQIHSVEERKKTFKDYRDHLEQHPEADDATRFTSTNYTHMAWNSDSPGRIEIRYYDSSLDMDTIIEDVAFELKKFAVSLENAKDSTYKSSQFQELTRHDVTEKGKVDRLVDLLFDLPEEKATYVRRWERVKDHKWYKKFDSGEPTYIREE